MTPNQAWSGGFPWAVKPRPRAAGQPFSKPLAGRIVEENAPAAVEVLQIADRLDPEARSAAANLRAAINNWALFECEQERFQQAAALIRQGLAKDPNYSPFLANDLHIHQRWAMHLCHDQHFSEALTVLDQAHARRPDVDLFNRGQLAVYREWTDALRRAGESDKADELSRLVTKQFGEGTCVQGSWLRCQ